MTASRRAANASVYFSGAASVPQIFIGDLHVHGAADLAALAEAGRLEALAASATGEIDLEGPTDAELERGAEDFVLRRVIPESDGTRDPDPEAWSILRFYKEFFGFWPNCFHYMHHWPEAYKLFVHCHNVGAIDAGREILGAPMMFAIGHATSSAHGCTYCRVHACAAGGRRSLDAVRKVEEARRGEGGQDGPFGPFEASLADLAASAATNTVTREQLERISALASEARASAGGAEASVMATAMVASAFGFLNVFNDLTGVEVEAEWAEQASAGAGIDAGRHGISHGRRSTNLDHDLPEEGPTMQGMIAKYEAIVAGAGGAEAYAERELGMVPAWIRAWPERLRARHVHLYVEIMQDRSHSPVPSELKHLMARVSAVAKGHDGLAAVEGFMAFRAGGGSARALERVRRAFDAAEGREDGGIRELFDERERAALVLARLSAGTPLVTPRRLVEPAVEAFTPVELVHLATVSGLASLVQRFTAIARPAISPEVRAFLDRNGLAASTLSIRYPGWRG